MYNSILVSPKDTKAFQAQFDKGWEREIQARMLKDYKNGINEDLLSELPCSC